MYTFISDSGHGWLRVPLSHIPKEVKEEISPYSYMTKQYAFLEEDCDADLFLSQTVFSYTTEERVAWFKDNVKAKVHTNGRSHIRNYDSYRYPHVLLTKFNYVKA